MSNRMTLVVMGLLIAGLVFVGYAFLSANSVHAPEDLERVGEESGFFGLESHPWGAEFVVRIEGFFDYLSERI